MLRRYPTDYVIVSSLDAMSDVLVLLEYLTSTEYLVEIMVKHHTLSKTEARQRAKEIVPHVKTGLDYIHQSLAGSPEVSFLLAYYGILNFLKVYILLGQYHSHLEKQPRHGASRPPHDKESQNILTEEILLWRKGALPLFYKTVTDRDIPISKRRRIKMSDVLPFLQDVAAEYGLATGKMPMVAEVRLSVRHERGKAYPLASVLHGGVPSLDDKRHLKVLKEFRKVKSSMNVFKGRLMSARSGVRADDMGPYGDELRKQFRTFLIYYPHPMAPNAIHTPICSKNLLLPEELPIALLFFYMSSVVRYKPEVLARLRDSKFWPMLAAARRHSLFKMMLLSWSYVHQQNLIIMHGGPRPAQLRSKG